MHIAYLINQFPPNVTAGLGRYAEALAPHLTREHRLTVFTVNDGHLPAAERHGPLRVHRPMGRLLRAVFRRRRLNRTRRLDFALLAANVVVGNLRHLRAIRALHRSEGIDVLAVHDVTNVVAALLCHRLLRLPLVFHLHTTEYSLAARGRLALGRGLERRLGRTAARVVVPTPELRDQLVADGWAADRIEVILQGNPLDRVSSAADPFLARAELGIAPDRAVVLFVGRLEAQKGIFTLVEALPAIVAADPSVVLVVVGEGDRDRVAALAAAGGVSDHVAVVERWLGVDELPSWYALADLCVFPSRFEPFGLVAAEAMSLGRPVLLGDGFSRVFAPAARYASSTDPALLSEALVELLADPGERRVLGERGRALVAESFDWSRTATETLAVYAAAVRRDTAPAATRTSPRPTT